MKMEEKSSRRAQGLNHQGRRSNGPRPHQEQVVLETRGWLPPASQAQCPMCRSRGQGSAGKLDKKGWRVDQSMSAHGVQPGKEVDRDTRGEELTDGLQVLVGMKGCWGWHTGRKLERGGEGEKGNKRGGPGRGPPICDQGFPDGLVVKNPLAIQETQEMGVQPLGWEESPAGGHGNPLQHSCLENPHGQRSLAGCSCGVTKSQTQLSMLAPFAPRVKFQVHSQARPLPWAGVFKRMSLGRLLKAIHLALQKSEPIQDSGRLRSLPTT